MIKNVESRAINIKNPKQRWLHIASRFDVASFKSIFFASVELIECLRKKVVIISKDLSFSYGSNNSL